MAHSPALRARSVTLRTFSAGKEEVVGTLWREQHKLLVLTSINDAGIHVAGGLIMVLDIAAWAVPAFGTAGY